MLSFDYTCNQFPQAYIFTFHLKNEHSNYSNTTSAKLYLYSEIFLEQYSGKNSEQHMGEVHAQSAFYPYRRKYATCSTVQGDYKITVNFSHNLLLLRFACFL